MNEKVQIGTVGLGLMGSSIACCLIAAGHNVVSVTNEIERETEVRNRILSYLGEMREEGLLAGDPGDILTRLTITDDYSLLKGSELVVETIIENIGEKKGVFRKLEEVLSETAIIGSNTSAIPVSLLQKDLKNPERLLAMHWAEPAHVTDFMEVICGEQTEERYAKRVLSLAKDWGKDPSLLKKDIRGFIANRVMYAMLREAFYLVENGYATIEDVDRSVRNDLGHWITFAGPFRFMDLTGIPAYQAVMKDLFKELDNSSNVPYLMDELVISGAKGVSNAHGFYSYPNESAGLWEKKFMDFSYEIRKLAKKYKQELTTGTI